MTPTPPTHAEHALGLEGRALLVARIVWFIVMGLALIVVALALPSWVELSQQIGDSTDTSAAANSAMADVFNIIAVGVALLVMTASLIMSVLLFRRAAVSRIAYFTSLYLIVYSTINLGPLEGAAYTLTGVSTVSFNYFDYVILFTAFLFWIFPSGRFEPRWLRYLVGPFLLLVIVWSITGTSAGAPVDNPTLFEQINNAIFTLLWFSIPLVQIYRYWRVSNPVERQQARWLMVGIVLWIVLIIVAGIGSESGSFPPGVAGMLWFLGLSMLPASLSIAILRYRLWAVDVIIRRTLTYALITLLLAGTYYGGVVLMQNIFVRITGQESALAIVASTLGIAALFNPLRNRVQSFIDRRFDRRKYDAQQTLEAFGDVARDEVNLEELERALVSTISGTMQPSHISLWLASTDQ